MFHSQREGWSFRAWWSGLRIEVSMWRSFCHVELQLSRHDDYALTIGAAIPWLLSVWISSDWKWVRRVACVLVPDDYSGERKCGLSFHNWTLWFDAWAKTMEHCPKDRWWEKTLSFDVLDWALGRAVYSERTKSSKSVSVWFDGRRYEGTIRLFVSEWKRPRWFKRRIERADVQFPGGIPIPGKGENSWDCGDDALYGQTSPCQDYRSAIENFLESVVRTRIKHGGGSWEPAAQ